MPNSQFFLYINLGDRPVGGELEIQVVVDGSGSMADEDKIGVVRERLADFVASAPERIRFGLTAFGDEVEVLCAPTDCREFITDQVPRLDADRGSTHLFEAVLTSAKLFTARQGGLADQRTRFLLVLTDGGDTTGGVPSPGDVVAACKAAGVRICCVGFGQGADMATLERLARGTDGAAWHVEGKDRIGDMLDAAFGWFTRQLDRIRVRSEHQRLLALDGVTRPEIVHVSIDPASVAGSDETHVWYAEGAVPVDEAGLEAFFEASVREQTEEIFLRNLRSLAAVGGLLGDVQVAVVGWVHDPIYRDFARSIVAMLSSLRARHIGLFQQNVPIRLVPMTYRLASQDDASLCAIHEWLQSVSGLDRENMPVQIIPCDDGNFDSNLNAGGYGELPREVLESLSANVLRALVDIGPNLPPMRAVSGEVRPVALGGASLGVDVARLAQLIGALRLKEVAKGLHEKTAWRALTEAEFLRMSPMLAATAIEGELLKPAETDSDGEQQYANLFVGLSRFWPAPLANEDAYLAGLLGTVDQALAEDLSRKGAILEATSHKRAASWVALVRGEIRASIDRILFGVDRGGESQSLELLRRLRRVCEQEIARIDAWSPDGVHLRDERVLVDRPKNSVPPHPDTVDSTRKRLRTLLAERPSRAAFVSRAAVLTGVVTAVTWLGFPLANALRGEPLPVWVGPTSSVILGASVAATAAWAWRRIMRRIRDALERHVNASIVEAKRLVAQHVLDVARGMLVEVRDRLIGLPDKVPADWTPGEERTEDSLTEAASVQLFASFCERLSDVAVRKVEEAWMPHENPFALEPGVRRTLPGESIARRLGSMDWPTNDSLDFGGIWHDVDIARWREVNRRAFRPTEAAFREFHDTRIKLPRRLRKSLERAAIDLAARESKVQKWLPGCSEVVPALELLAFPPVRLTSSANPTEAQGSWHCEPSLWRLDEVRTAVGPSWTEVVSPTSPATEATRVRLFRVPPDQLLTFVTCERAWRRVHGSSTSAAPQPAGRQTAPELLPGPPALHDGEDI